MTRSRAILHIGIGSGYYTAILAVLAGNGGAIHAYEIDAPLAALAKERLAGFPQVRVRATSGVAADPPEAGVIYVNASATAPDAAWLRALRPGGRLIFPWQPGAARGSVALLVTRAASGFRAIPTMAVGFIPCAGAQASPSPGVGDPWETRSVWFAADRSPDESATAVYPDMWFSSMPIEG